MVLQAFKGLLDNSIQNAITEPSNKAVSLVLSVAFVLIRPLPGALSLKTGSQTATGLPQIPLHLS